MSKYSLKDRARYFFDSTLSSGPLGLLIWLGLFSITVIILVASFVWTVGASPKESILEQAWFYTLTSLGAFWNAEGGTWLFRLSSLVVVFTAIFVIGTLISILTSAFSLKIEQLKKGRSRVIESDHSLILGWGEETLILIKELVTANENHANSCITILAQEDKTLMEGRIRDYIGPHKQTRIVCRNGNPSSISDLDLVSINTAKSIMILGSINDKSDLSILKTVLAIINNPNRREKPYHIVTAIDSPKVLDAIKMISKDEIEVIHKGEFVTKIEAQTLLQAGLSMVITDLLDFKGDEIYFKNEPKLIGKTYKEVSHSFNSSTVIGFHKSNHEILLNPPYKTLLEEGDQIIAISNDDDTIKISKQPSPLFNSNAINLHNFIPPEAKNILILGWNLHTIKLINHIYNNTPKNSHVIVAASCKYSKIEVEKYVSSDNLTLEHIETNPSERVDLETLPFNRINHVVILPSYENELSEAKISMNQLDANTLVTLLNVREIRDLNKYPLTITSELMDIENRSLIETKDNDDFVVSDHLISLAIGQISENKSLSPIFNSIFDPEDNEIYLKPITNYINIGEPVNFFTIVEAALLQNETALGYRFKLADIPAFNGKEHYDIVLNPTKTDLVNFNPDDKIIVLADDDERSK